MPQEVKWFINTRTLSLFVLDPVTGSGLARWKLHNQFKKDNLDSVIVELEIRTTQNDSDNDNNSLVDPGHFELHYMELVKEPIECTSFSAHGMLI